MNVNTPGKKSRVRWKGPMGAKKWMNTWELDGEYPVTWECAEPITRLRERMRENAWFSRPDRSVSHTVAHTVSDSASASDSLTRPLRRC